jgi:undecaprenyl diphosphate synthase
MSASEVPLHLGLIIDGNRRWAKAKGLPTFEGHRRGLEGLKKIIDEAFDLGVDYVTVYVFSKENWNRTKEEVAYLMDLVTRTFLKDAKSYIKRNIKINILGRRENVPKKVLSAIDSIQADSKDNTGKTVSFCFNYGGLDEITDAVKRVVKSGIKSEEITDQTIMENLYHPEVPPIDFMIRTSGEARLSNFMLARMAYAELYFEEKNWPDFTKADLQKALDEFARRNRRFGGN